MKCILAGASGLVGNLLLKELIADKHFSEIIILVRKELDISSKKVKQVIFNFEDENEYEKLNVSDVVFCCLGTTIKVAKTKENFRKVDFQYPLNLAVKVQSKKYFLISSMGANANSSIFYSKTKGQLEDELKKLNFASLKIFRPSQIVGNRKIERKGEIIFEKLMNVFKPFIPRKYQSINAKIIAKAMKIEAIDGKSETKIFLSDEIKQIVINETK